MNAERGTVNHYVVADNLLSTFDIIALTKRRPRDSTLTE